MIDNLLRWFRTPPDCREVARILQAYLDGELPPAENHLVAEHLEYCERCGIEAEIYAEVKRSLSELGTPADPGALQRLRSYAEGLVADEEA